MHFDYVERIKWRESWRKLCWTPKALCENIILRRVIVVGAVPVTVTIIVTVTVTVTVTATLIAIVVVTVVVVVVVVVVVAVVVTVIAQVYTL